MTDTSNQEYTRFSITSKQDPSSGRYSINTYNKDINAIVNAVKSALPKDAYFSVASKELTKQGKLKVDIYTHKEDATNVQKALDEQINAMPFKGSADNKYDFVRRRNTAEDITSELRKADFAQTNKEEIKEEQKTAKERLSLLLKIAGTVTVLTDIARRILTSVLTMATQAVKDATTAHNLGTSYARAKELGYVETAHGLEKGTITEAMTDIQSKFGNITDIDEKALGQLALVMGSEIEDLVKSGIGGDRPEELLGKILDAYNKQANAGYNSVGQYVGEQEARRELYSQLSRISPKIADIFSMMQEEMHNVNSIYRDQSGTYAGWKDTINTNRYDVYTAELGLIETLGQQTNAVKSMIEQIKTGILVKVAPALTKALEKIGNLRNGMSQEDNWELDEKNRKANEAYINQLNKQLEDMPENTMDANAWTTTGIYTANRATRANRAIRSVIEGYIKEAQTQNARTSVVGNAVQNENQLVVDAYKAVISDYETALAGGNPFARPYGTDVMWTVINQHLKTGDLSQDEVDKLKDARVKDIVKQIKKLSKATTDKQAKARVEDEIKKVKLEAEAEYKLQTGRKYATEDTDADLHDAIIKAEAEYLGIDATKLKGGYGTRKLYIVNSERKEAMSTATSKMKDTMDAENKAEVERLNEEKNEILSNIVVDSDALARAIFDAYSENHGLEAEAEQLGRDWLKKAVLQNPVFSASLINEEVIKGASDRLQVGTAYDTIGATDSTGTYKIVLDINRDNKADAKDLVLWEGQGADFFQGNLGMQITVDAKGNITKSNMTGTSASQQQAQNK